MISPELNPEIKLSSIKLKGIRFKSVDKPRVKVKQRKINFNLLDNKLNLLI